MTSANPTEPGGVIDALRTYNAGRDPQLLAMKYANMARDPFIFLRGACHLFYDALPALPAAPLVWACGDLHFENFGSYKGDNRLVYFDINDFDEAALAPATWDLLRLLTSIECGAEALHATAQQAITVRESCLDAYRQALANGKPMWIERDTSTGLINTLLTDLDQRKRAAFLNKRSELKDKQRRLKVDGKKALPASEKQDRAVRGFMKTFASTQPRPEFYKVLDVALRIAGTGSLGLQRFIVLIEGKGTPDGNYLLDIKQTLSSALAPALARHGIIQPAFDNEAQRVATVQQRLQAVDNALLHAVTLDGMPCILRELQPSADRVAFDTWGKDLDRLRDTVAIMGRILAWDQLRASGRDGADNADALIAWARRDDWAPAMLDAASVMTGVTRQQWQASKQWLTAAT
jgi:uncharacterized protein (DUF2252 family)